MGGNPTPLILDDQALVATIRGHGLVVLTSCGHSGVIRFLRYVRKLTGEDRIHVVLGGLHLSGRAFEPIIGPTCDALGDFSPEFLVPAHCTGWRATHALASRFPEAFIQNSVGTRFKFAATTAELLLAREVGPERRAAVGRSSRSPGLAVRLAWAKPWLPSHVSGHASDMPLIPPK